MFCGDDLRIRRWVAAGLAASPAKGVYQMPVAGYDTWRMQFEFDHDSVLYMTLIDIR
jgi:hypothetical protein